MAKRKRRSWTKLDQVNHQARMSYGGVIGNVSVGINADCLLRNGGINKYGILCNDDPRGIISDNKINKELFGLNFYRGLIDNNNNRVNRGARK